MQCAMAAAVPWSFAVLPLIDSGRPAVFTAAIVVTYVIIGTAMGPIATYLPELFAARYRYTGTAISYNIGGILGGGIPPVVSPALLSSFGAWAVGLMMGALTSVSLICLWLLGERKQEHREIHTAGTRPTA